MGKVKKSRQKLHLKAVKFGEKKPEDSVLEANESTLPAIFPTVGLFSSENVTDTETGKESSCDVPKKKICKIDKRKERHEEFLKKLHASRLVEEKVKKAEIRAKTVIVGDMEPLLTSLPTIALETDIDNQGYKSEKATTRSAEGKLSKKGNKARQKSHMPDIKHFQQVVDHPAFKANPLGAITEHIRNVIQRDNEVSPS